MSAKRTSRAPARSARPARPVRAARVAPPSDEEADDAAIDEGDEEEVVERVNHEAQIGRGRQGNGRSRHSRTAHSRQASRKIRGFDVAELAEFIREEENVLPHVPDTEEWHYHWGRDRIGEKDDGSNVHDKLNGRMGYEVVTEDKLPPGFSLKPLQIKAGDHMGGFRYRDCILLRCPMINYRKWLAAAEYRTRQLNDMLDAGAQAARIEDEDRTDGIFVETNREKTGVRREAYEHVDA